MVSSHRASLFPCNVSTPPGQPKPKGGNHVQRSVTNNAGAPVVDNENALTAGPRGPMLLQDTWFSKSWPISTVKSFPNAVCTPKAPAHTARLRLPRHHPLYQSLLFSQIGKTDLFAFSPRLRANAAPLTPNATSAASPSNSIRIRATGISWRQHASLLPPRPAEIPRPEPRGQTRSPHQHAQRQNNWDFWTLCPKRCIR